MRKETEDKLLKITTVEISRKYRANYAKLRKLRNLGSNETKHPIYFPTFSRNRPYTLMRFIRNNAEGYYLWVLVFFPVVFLGFLLGCDDSFLFCSKEGYKGIAQRIII